MEKALRILLIEDDEVDRITIRRAIRSRDLNYQLDAFGDAKSGSESLRQTDYDIILLDYRLPDANGIEVLKELKTISGSVPIIIITSQGDEKVAADAIRFGASDYIPKSLLTPDGLEQSIRNALRLQESDHERRKAETALRVSQERLASVIGNADLMIFSVDLNGIFTISEGKGLEKLGLRPGQLVGKNVFEFFKDWEEITIPTQKALEGITSEEIAEVNGMYFSNYFQPIYDDEKNIIGVTAISTDQTDHILAEQNLIKAKMMAEETAQLKQEFLANMSHEIRTPMNAIIGFTNILMESEIGPTQKEYVSSIKTSGESLLVLINDILDFSKIEAGKMSIEQVPFNLKKLLSDLEKTYSFKAEEKGLSLNVKSLGSWPENLIGDPVRINQVLVNLVGNAIKFTEKGEVNIFIQAEKEVDKNIDLIFRVQDTGVGIPQEKIGSIFESFTQVSGNYTRKVGGTGLGLAIVKNLVGLMHGEIRLMSEPGEGSEFAVKLPLGIAKVQLPVNAENSDDQGNAEALKNLRVLVVEDNTLNQKLALHILGQLDVDSDLASNGIEAIEKIKAKPFDLILMDIQMPEMDGLTATSIIRNELNNEVPIIALTAHAMKEEIEKCMKAGMNDHVTKPFKKELLIEKMAAFAK